MTVTPIYHECEIRDDVAGTKGREECVTILRRDYRSLVVGVKAACLAAGGTDEECLVAGY